MKIKQLMSWHWLRLPGLGNNNEKLGLPQRLSGGIQFRFRNLFHGKISGNRSFICQSYLVLLLPGSSRDFIIEHIELKELLLSYISICN